MDGPLLARCGSDFFGRVFACVHVFGLLVQRWLPAKIVSAGVALAAHHQLPGDPRHPVGERDRRELGGLRSNSASSQPGGFFAAPGVCRTDRVDEPRALALPPLSLTRQHQSCLLIRRFRRHEAHVRPACRLAQRRRVGRIVLAART
jgi:hypothetical protein